jgi:hypothetical protein
MKGRLRLLIELFTVASRHDENSNVLVRENSARRRGFAPEQILSLLWKRNLISSLLLRAYYAVPVVAAI